MRLSFFSKLFYSLPLRLLLSQLKRHQILLVLWLLLFAIITNQMGAYLGIPSLFLDPEYLSKVNFLSFLIMGIALAGFSIAYHITCYILDGYKFHFLGSLSKPFTHFSINNSLIPLVFLIVYIIRIIAYQLYHETASGHQLLLDITGLLTGYLAMTITLYTYFWFTNKDIFKVIAYRFDSTLKKKVRVTRATAMNRLVLVKHKPEKVRYYLNLRLQLVPVKDRLYDKTEVTKVFDQNHLNLVFIELFIFLLILLLGLFRDYEIFQIPAAASAVLFLTIAVMFTGAFSYWFGSWSATAALAFFLILNLVVKYDVLKSRFEAFGLHYDNGRAPYNLNVIKEQNSDSILVYDHNQTLQILQNWHRKLGRPRPKMVLLAVSGGGQRSALWTFRSLQYADSLTGGRLFDHSMLITGASGGLIGAAYFRELKLRQQENTQVNPYDPVHLQHIARDNLNPIIFSFLVNDLFVKFQKFTYNNRLYTKDRGYSFEEQLNRNTGFLLDKPLIAYRQPEQEARIPMMLIAPTIINDGRKLFISPQHVSYLNAGNIRARQSFDKLVEGIDFTRFYRDYGADSLRFLSALRMGATFPYVTPNVTLPSEPPMEIMDAGITDNFGISDALRFLYAYRQWIAAHTSGVIIVSIRDSRKQVPIAPRDKLSLLDRLFTPVQSVYENYAKMQSISNDSKLEYATSWFNNQLDVITLQYVPTYDPHSQSPEEVHRAALNWRLTGKEKKSIVFSIRSKSNQAEMRRLQQLLK